MAWTAPMTFVAGTALTGAQLNTYLRDNFNETAPAKATTPGYHFVSTGPNAIAERAVTNDIILTSETTATASDWVDLATAGPTVSVTTGAMALVFMTAEMQNNTANMSTQFGVEVSGASSIGLDANSDFRGIGDGNPANSPFRFSVAHLETGLTPGVNVFTMKYRILGGTGLWKNRELIVMGL